jgi:hypothetical protein
MVLLSALVVSCTTDEQIKTTNAEVIMEEETDTLLVNLNSSNEYVRSAAAFKMAEIGHPDALEACIQTFNDAPSFAHLDRTPSSYGLILIGLKGLPRTAELMLSDDEMTRLRAFRVIEEVTSEYWKAKNPEDETQMLEEWKSWLDTIGLSYTDNLEKRSKSVELLKQWLSKN